jgi:hypothetical protein
MLRRFATVLFSATRELFTNWRALAITVGLYALLLANLYLLLTTREATKAQVGITLALALVAPVIFFLLQSIGVNREKTVRALALDGLRKSWKLVVVSIPLIAIVILSAYLLNKAQLRFGVTVPLDQSVAVVQENAKPPIHYPALAITTVRYLLLAVLAPLALIHLWISTNRDGLLATFKKLHSNLARAFRAQSLLIYIIGFGVFAVAPYLLLFKTTSSSRAWLEVGLFSARLVAVFLMTLLGWLWTVRALSLTSDSAPPAASGNA